MADPQRKPDVQSSVPANTSRASKEVQTSVSANVPPNAALSQEPSVPQAANNTLHIPEDVMAPARQGEKERKQLENLHRARMEEQRKRIRQDVQQSQAISRDPGSFERQEEGGMNLPETDGYARSFSAEQSKARKVAKEEDIQVEEQVRAQREKKKPKISLIMGALILCYVVILDTIGVILVFFALDDFGILDFAGGVVTQIYFRIKGVRSDYDLLATVLEIIPYVGALPIKTIGVVVVLILDRSERAQKFAGIASGAMKGSAKGLKDGGKKERKTNIMHSAAKTAQR